MTPNIWIFSLEPIDTRYTGQWFNHVPKLLTEHLGSKYNVIQIDGVQKSTKPTPGAFLNFSDTNYWKSSQMVEFLKMYNNGNTTPNDYFLFTDAWNPTCIQIKYMGELLGYNWKLGGLWHAGSYDPQDFLGRLIGDAPWVRHAEKSFFECYDHNYFATDFHIHMFMRNLWGPMFDDDHITHSQRETWMEEKKIVRAGWPMEYMGKTLENYRFMEKENIVLFPHRIAPEKQVEIFKDLGEHIPEAKFVVCQEEKLTKHDYHELLGKAKIVFSANLQETLGISMYEGALVNAVPLVPNRLSYIEMYPDAFKYPSPWTESWGHYEQNREHLVARIRAVLGNHHKWERHCGTLSASLSKNFFSAGEIIKTIK
jgi:hypothetical protein